MAISGILVAVALAFSQDVIHLSKLDLIANKEEVRSLKKDDKALVYFWASWCSDCKETLKTTLKKMHERGVAVFAVNRDRKAKKALHYVKKYGLKIPVYRDESKGVSKILKAFSVPHWAVVNSQGDGKFKVLKLASGGLEDALAYFKE